MIRMVACYLVFCFLTGCASMFCPGPDIILISTNPEGAMIKLDNVDQGKTPLQVTFQRECNGVLTLEKDGYQPVIMDVDKVFNGYFLLNIPWCIGIVGPIGIIVDLLAHNQGKYPSQPIFIKMEELRGGKKPEGKEGEIAREEQTADTKK